ncbi:nucleoside hydrolase-like domain-containing protein [Novipirellula artificiosorum]|uniref:DUF1593 domain-containing protein n=1 Tax=Novipirellula artificiosorum TaxID=2528016 RepID=A0A5C6D2Y7_9BACT|nr:nucleoside hydrolase-like domain-containing protein [Novipirellula artificiosorum]TWU31200.1 hypothetical protein Poly41_63910 [Novipirellula artificiosorum]
MNRKLILCVFCILMPVQLTFAVEKTRLIIMADMGNEPDEEQQMMHMLMYSNMFDLEGLVACSGKYLHDGRDGFKGHVHPELFHKLIDGYAKVVGNLEKHAAGWPDPIYLRSIVKAGTAEYGIAAVAEGKSTDASKLVEAAILKNDPRKLYLVGNAGTNTLAQALVDLDKTRSPTQMDVLCKKLVVFENGAQDNSGAWIANKYPEIAWHRSNRQTYCYGGPGTGTNVEGPYTWEPYPRTAEGQGEWSHEHIQANHGELGRLFPDRIFKDWHFIEGGGTIPWTGLANHGLSDPEHLCWGGWSGRFSRSKHKNVWSRHAPEKADEQSYGDFYMFEADSEQEEWTDPVHSETFDNSMVPVWRFRRAMFNDFRGRMDWCVKAFDEANHNPIATVNGDKADDILHLQVSPGQTLSLDASDSSDPDGDALTFRWWVYKEAGTYDGSILITHPNHEKTELSLPTDAGGKEIHVILEVLDKNPEIGMSDYRRVVLEVM